MTHFNLLGKILLALILLISWVLLYELGSFIAKETCRPKTAVFKNGATQLLVTDPKNKCVHTYEWNQALEGLVLKNKNCN